MADTHLDARLAATRAKVAHQRLLLEELRRSCRDLRRSHVEVLAQASVAVDGAIVLLLRRQGVPMAEPPIPSYPPADLRP